MKSHEIIMRIKLSIDESEKQQEKLLEELKKTDSKEAERLKIEMYKGNSERNRKIIDRLLEILNEVIFESTPKDNHNIKLFR